LISSDAATSPFSLSLFAYLLMLLTLIFDNMMLLFSAAEMPLSPLPLIFSPPFCRLLR